MPDIDPAALSRSHTISGPITASLTNSKLNGASAPLPLKTTKSPNTAQRIDLEPLYTSLKAAIGEHWANYKEAISFFLLGHLNQNELSLRIDHYVTVDPSTVHLHNQLIAAIYGNVIRDLPDQGVAPWVSANDKPVVLSKPVSGDAAEQRLKTEVMQLPARERRRLKEVPDVEVTDTMSHAVATSMTDYHLAKQIKMPDNVPASAGGLNKSNWDLEIRKRYSQPLASETGEFPDTDAIQGRMVPICYEESLPNGAGASCAEFMATATEQYIKAVVSSILARTRSNVPAAGGSGIMTRKYRRQLEREEEAFQKGEVVRGVGSGLLPVEAREAGGRRRLGMGDLRLAVGIGGCELGQMPGLVKGIMGGWEEGVLEGWTRKGDAVDDEMEEMERWGARMNGVINGGYAADDGTETDDGDYGWEGGGATDRTQLNWLLDEILAGRS
ncbi:transcriptional coactivator hfi1/ADA1 [Sticta canariensis]|nr:transcriptional coactivator hfi1/ADA1 [Sticta canariensis]